MSLKIGLIGAGRIGIIHGTNIANFADGAELTGIADVNLESAQNLARKLNVNFTTEDYNDLINDPEIDAVFICSSTDTHAQIIEAAAAAGKHIFCEKPVDVDINRIKQLQAIVDNASVKFMLGFNRRFDRNFSHLKKQIAAGELGEPHILRITSRDPAPPPIDYIKHSGGIFLDMTIHDFDMARYLIGSEVTEVFAKGAVRVDPAIGNAGDIDTAIITLQFENGVIGTIDNSRQAVYGYDQRVEVFGSNGMIAAGNELEHQNIFANADGVRAAKPQYFFLERYLQAYQTEASVFIDCIINDNQPPVSIKDGLMALAMGLAAKTSVAENRVVEINEFL